MTNRDIVKELPEMTSLSTIRRMNRQPGLKKMMENTCFDCIRCREGLAFAQIKRDKFSIRTKEMSQVKRMISALMVILLSVPMFSGCGGASRFAGEDVESYLSYVAEYENTVKIHPGSLFRAWFASDGEAAGHVQSWIDGAESGDAKAAFLAGGAYYFGCAVEKDYVTAASYYRRAADKGYAPAQFALGKMLDESEGVKKDQAAAVELYRKSAEQGYAPAQYSLATALYWGRGIAKDLAASAEWLTKAAEAGHADAETLLGCRYHYGEGVDKDLETAARYFRSAAGKGHAWAQYRIGMAYRDGAGVEKNRDEAVKWFKMGARQHSDRSMVQMLQHGESWR